METNNQTKQELFKKILDRGFWKEVPLCEENAAQFLRALFYYLFPVQCECMPAELQLEQGYLNVYKNLRELCQPVQNMECSFGMEFESRFLNNISQVYDLLIEDAEAIFRGDPAAKSIEEIIHIYPGFYATFVHRMAHVFYAFNMPVLARMLSENAHSTTGIDIHPGASIGRSFSIDHGTGIVIGETAEIGNNVKIYQGVTLGALSVGKELADIKRHPTIEDNVVVYAGATILGGDTIIGKNSTIGGNVFITRSIPENTVVYYNNELSVKSKNQELVPVASPA
jgi:Serine acetyltransferase